MNVQRKTHSLIESIVNTFSGFVVSYIAGLVVFPLFGWDATLTEIGGVTLIYTALSVVRKATCY